jgi:two-component system chemotaxis response regulator CheB
MVQDPATADFASMPESALSYVAIDWCLPVRALASKVISLATTDRDERKGADLTVDEMNEAQREQLRIETEIAGLNPETIFTPPPHSLISSYTCPDCHGPMWGIQDGPLLRFRCRVGHAFTAESMVEGHADTIEESLWMALNTLKESEQLYHASSNMQVSATSIGRHSGSQPKWRKSADA